MHFYDDHGVIYPTHIDAIKSRKPCKFYYNDSFYDTIDWKTESTLSLNELYKLRAEEIRSNYEYVVLCLSGGVDSRNVFETFYKNKIHIDEILCVGAYSQDGFKGSTENNNDEIYTNVYPLLNEVDLPGTTITFYDYSKLFSEYKNFSVVKSFENDWAYKLPFFKSFHHFFWYDLGKYLGLNESKKTCYVMGTGKTNVCTIKDGKFLRFAESEVMDYGARYKIGNLYRENFYFGTTTIAAEIVKKQAHNLFRYYDLMEDKKSFWKDYFKIYPTINYELQFPLIAPTRKCSMPFFSHRDTFMNKNANSDIYSFWYNGIKKLSDDIGLNYKTHYTKLYSLKG